MWSSLNENSLFREGHTSFVFMYSLFLSEEIISLGSQILSFYENTDFSNAKGFAGDCLNSKRK